MKTFDEICQELQSADNSELNKVWEEAKEEKKRANRRVLIICLIVDIILWVFLYSKTSRVLGFSIFNIMWMIVPVLVIDIIIYAVINAFGSKKQIEYIKLYKNVTINKMINNFYTQVEYFPEKEMPEYIYEEANYSESYNRYSSEDYFEGQLDGKHSLQMAEVETEKEETHTDSEGRTHTTTHTIFHGLFAKIVMDKSINSHLGIFQCGGSYLSSEQLKMDSSEFEKYFDVQASDKIIGMQILTSDVMAELVDFYNKTNMEYDINIINDTLYLRFHCGSMFEPENIKNSALDRESLEKYFYMLNFTYNLSNKMIKTINETEI